MSNLVVGWYIMAAPVNFTCDGCGLRIPQGEMFFYRWLDAYVLGVLKPELVCYCQVCLSDITY